MKGGGEGGSSKMRSEGETNWNEEGRMIWKCRSVGAFLVLQS